MALTLCTTILRDGVLCDVTVAFTAECVLAATRACWDDPGFPAEYVSSFVGAELDCPESADDRLTDAELETLRGWFEGNWDKASEAANDNEVGAAP